jgi:ATP-dependent helicase/nuclease subunit B
MELVTGPFRPGLEAAFREAFAQAKRGDPLSPLAVVAPSQRLADHLKLIALEAVPAGFANVRFHNLFSFARWIAGEAVDGRVLVMDDLVPERLVRAILRRHFADTPYLSRAALAPRALLQALRTLKAGAVNAGKALVAVVEEVLGKEEAPKLSELLSLYKRYQDELQRRKLVEPADVAALAVEAAERSPELRSCPRVFYYGFTELDQNQLSLLGSVDRVSEVVVFYPYADTPGYAFAKDFLESVLVGKARTRRTAPGDLAPPRITQVSTSGARDEVWTAAKEVLRFADLGVPFDRIGVVARSLEPYLDLVETVFAEHRIPWVSSARRRLFRDPRVKAARLLFTIDDFDRAGVLDLLRSPFLKDRRGDRELWDQASRLMGIGRGADEWRRRLGKAAGKDWVHAAGIRAGRQPFTLPRTEVDLFWGGVKALLEAPSPPDKGWRAYADWALDRVRTFLEPDPRIEGALDSLARLEGFALEDPREALIEALEELSEPAGTPELGGVKVYDAMAARGCSFDALVVVGLNEKVFPRFILEDPFLRDAVRSRFEHRLGNRIPMKGRGYEEELMLYTLLERSADEIVLVHQRSDEKGRLQIPSPFLPPGEPRAVPRQPARRLEEIDFTLLTPDEAALRTRQGEALRRARGLDVSMIVDAQEFTARIETRGELTPYDGLVDMTSSWPALARHGISPTSLERLVECPFRYYAQGPLGLEELEEPEYASTLTPLEEGDLLHDLLERVYPAEDVEAALDVGFRAFEEGRSIRWPVLWQIDRERLSGMVRALLEVDDLSRFKPKHYEMPLKGELRIEAGGLRSVTFRGYADRVDVASDGSFRVIDYKRSGKKYGTAMETGVFGKGTYLQPPLYFLLVQQILKAPAETSRFAYYFLREAAEGARIWSRELSGTMWEQRPLFEAHLKRNLERIARGEFTIRPGRQCGHCAFRTACRRSHWPTRQRAEGAAGVDVEEAAE